MVRRLLRKIGAGALALLLTLTGCGTANEVHNYAEQPAPTKQLTFFGNKYEPENVTIIEEILTDFMLEHKDVQISYESLKGADYYTALEKRMAADSADDIFMVNHDTALAFTMGGKLADLSGLDAISEFSKHMLSQMTEPDGSIYWVPTTISAFGLYCNLDLLKEHKQKVPATLAEWQAVCDHFVSQGMTPIVANNDISLKTLAIALGFYPLYRDNRQQETFARINAGEALLSDYLKPGFALAEAFCQKGYIDAAAALETKKTSDDLAAFAEGNAPFMLTGAWAAGRFKALEPDFDFQVIPYPVLEDGSVLVINPDTRLSVSADSTEPQAALDFVSYFLQQENIQKFADNQASFSPLQAGSATSLPELQPVVDSFRTSPTVIGSDSLLDFPIWDLTADACALLLAGNSLEQTMDWLDEQVLVALHE